MTVSQMNFAESTEPHFEKAEVLRVVSISPDNKIKFDIECPFYKPVFLIRVIQDSVAMGHIMSDGEKYWVVQWDVAEAGLAGRTEQPGDRLNRGDQLLIVKAVKDYVIWQCETNHD